LIRHPEVFGKAAAWDAPLMMSTSGGTKKDADAPKIPTYWEKLDLTKEQRDKMFAVMDDYRPKRQVLLKREADLKSAEQADMLKVLTDEQRAQLLKHMTDTPAKREDTKKADSQKRTGSLPPLWESLMLTTEQRDKLTSIKAAYRPKAAEAVTRLNDLKSEEKTAMVRLLTDEQKARLLQMLTGEYPSQKDKEKRR
jgi:Spy/CpxP family protein refolding chaperone